MGTGYLKLRLTPVGLPEAQIPGGQRGEAKAPGVGLMGRTLWQLPSSRGCFPRDLTGWGAGPHSHWEYYSSSSEEPSTNTQELCLLNLLFIP